MYRILEKRTLAPRVNEYVIEAKEVAQHARPGQFIILRVDEKGERIPFTICDYDKSNGTVTILVQEVGYSTAALSKVPKGGNIADFVGPLGTPTHLDGLKKVAVVGGGVGCAIALPVARALHERGCEVTSIVGFRNQDLVILEDEFKAISDRFFMMTDDGSYGEKGNVCVPLNRLLESGETFDEVITIGPLIMMKFVAAATKPYGIRTVASMNPIMIDGTGMCGCCRVTVGGEMKFACVDGPDFDAHLIDFDEAMKRSRTYSEFEAKAREKHCNLFKKTVV